MNNEENDLASLEKRPEMAPCVWAKIPYSCMSEAPSILYPR